MLLNIDWLAINAKGLLDKHITVVNFDSFQIENTGKKTAQFNTLLKVTYNCIDFAYIVAHSHSPVIDPALIQIKVENSWLYDVNCLNLLKQLVENLKLTNVRVSRLDLAVDLQQFANGIEPHQLISEFASGKLRKIGRSKYTVTGSQSPNGQIYETLKFGNHSSKRAVYLYNKSQEMKAKTDKLYIRDCWANNETFDLNKDVWRLEISLKMGDISIEQGKGNIIEKISLETLGDTNLMKAVYLSVINALFSFTYKTDATNITYADRLQLFDETSDIKVIHVTEKQTVGRAEKIHLNYLVSKVYFKYNDHGFVELEESFIDYLDYFLNQKRLHKYFIHKHYECLRFLPETMQQRIYEESKN